MTVKREARDLCWRDIGRTVELPDTGKGTLVAVSSSKPLVMLEARTVTGELLAWPLRPEEIVLVTGAVVPPS